MQISKPLSLTVEKGKIGAVQVESGAENAKIQVEKDGTVSKVEAKAKGTQISGAGSVGEVHASGDQVQVFTENTKVTTGDNVSGVQAGGKEVQPKTTVTTDQKSAEEELPVRKKKHSSGSSSSSSGSSEEKQKGVLADGVWYGTDVYKRQGFGLRQQAVADKAEGLPIDYVDPTEGNFSLTESVAVVDKGDATNPLAQEMAQCIIENGRSELQKYYPNALYEGETTSSENASAYPKTFAEPLTVELLESHQALSESCK